MGSVVTAGDIQSLQSEESNTITASVSAQPITEISAVACAPEMLPVPHYYSELSQWLAPG